MKYFRALTVSQTVLESAHPGDAFIDALRRMLIAPRFRQKAFVMNLKLFEDHALAPKQPLQQEPVTWRGYIRLCSLFPRAAW